MTPPPPSLRSRFVALVIAVATVTAAARASEHARVRETSIALTVDGRPMSRSTTAAVEREGVAYVDLVAIVRTFNGLLSLRKNGTLVTIGAHEASFRSNDARARIDGEWRRMPHAAFSERGDLYVPLAFFVRNLTPDVALRFDDADAAIDLHVPAPPLRTK